MARIAAASVEEYLDALPEERRAVIAAVRALVRKHLPKGYTERANWGMISYEIPLAIHPKTYNGQPLQYVALAAQKNHYALYLLPAGSPPLAKKLRDGYAKAGKKLDMGKSCLRFKSLDDLVPAVIGEVIEALPPKRWIEITERSRGA